jgi:AcrR family transcriptional regulator
MEKRLRAIYDAASYLFINKGYARTQMKDIAKHINLSTGMLYVYFDSKKTLLDFLLKATVDPAFFSREHTLPLTANMFSELNIELIAAFEENTRTFSSHTDLVRYPYEEMLSDAFDIIRKYGTGCLIIENNPDDVGTLKQYYDNYRTAFFSQVLGYVQCYIQNGSFRAVPYVDYTVQLIIETISWWAMHVMNDAYELNREIDPAVAKAVCLDNLINAYKL